jgi:hypothetical protein
MANVETYVWHDATGKIIAVGRAMNSESDRVTPIATRDTHGAVVVDVPEHLVKSLHQTHRIDMAHRRLVAEEST